MTTEAGTEQAEAFHALLKALYESKGSQDLLQKSRAKAWDQYVELGLPSRKTEVFRYIKLRHLFSPSYTMQAESKISSEQVSEYIYPECLQSAAVFVNGCFRPDLSRLEALPTNVVIASLPEASKTYSAFLTNQWTKSLKDEQDPFAAVNGALYDGSVFIYVPPRCSVEAPLQILHLIQHEEEQPILLMPRVHLMAGKQSQLSFISSTCVLGKTKYGINQVLELSLEEGAHVQAVQTASTGEGEGWHFEALRSSLKRDSTLKTTYVSEGSTTTRFDYRIALEGENSEVSLNGVWMLKGKREAHTNVLIEHQAPHCRSNQLFKGVLQDISRSSFEGKIFVKPEAQKTEAFQLNSNLLLSDLAHADSKPNLEIFADDVKASHGATVGQLNADEVFYLTTKGIPAELAKNLLVDGYCKEVIDLITIPSLREKLRECSRRICCG